ncbi:hypothetical protein K1719_040019 [Acacia pycnantha]|nr:hypothetical protein K1719_040019 [Acacia pycnantha]
MNSIYDVDYLKGFSTSKNCIFQTLASKSESVIGFYRRDLEEFGSGLKKETTIIPEATSRAVKNLPALLDVGASVAQESLESVGQAIDDIDSSVWKSTTKLHQKLLKQISESCKDSDTSVVSSQPSMPEEEDIGLDEIEDMGSNDDNKGVAAGTTSRIDLQKRLSSAKQEEDLRSSRRCDFLYALQL